MGHHLPDLRDLVIPSLDDSFVGRDPLYSLYRRAAARVDDPLDTADPRRFEDVEGPREVGVLIGLPGRRLAGLCGEMDHDIYALECGGDRIQVAYVGLVAFYPLDRPPIQSHQFVFSFQTFPHNASDQPAHARHEDSLARHVVVDRIDLVIFFRHRGPKNGVVRPA